MDPARFRLGVGCDPVRGRTEESTVQPPCLAVTSIPAGLEEERNRVRLCSVLARAGSVELPGKNTRTLGGVPLVAHSIRHARESAAFDAIAVSSDDETVLEIAEREGVEVLVRRPPEFATAEAPKMPALRHCVESSERALGVSFDTVVDIQPTSPLRLASDILRAVELLERSPVATNVVSVGPSRSSPDSTLVEIDRPTGFLRLVRPRGAPPARRQDEPEVFAMNGSIYAWRREALTEDARVIGSATYAYPMPAARSFDIDTLLDWEIVAFLYGRPDLWKALE